MTGARRFSQAISEGDGISLVAEVDDAESARRAEGDGAEALIVYSGLESRLRDIQAVVSLPIVFFWDGEKSSGLEGADACIIDVTGNGVDAWTEHAHLELDGFELVLRVDQEEQLNDALESFDPEIFVLAAKESEPLERVLELLQDVPAGKLAIAELAVRGRDDVAELERAGMDAVIVPAGDVAELVGGSAPDV